MASVAQVLANRSNAQKSTGPRTAEGKALVAQNAVKHGLLAQRVVVKGEDPEEFALYREGMLEDLEPAGSVEALLAERVVNLAWRLRRAERLEGAVFDVLEAQRVAKARDQPGANDVADDEEAVRARMVVQDFGKHKLLVQLLGYERRIENSLYRTMNELRKQRLLREVESSEYRLQAGQESVPSAVPTPPSPPVSGVPVGASEETPYGVTTNGAPDEDQLCETKPIEVTSDKWPVTNEEAPASSASEVPIPNVALQAADTLCETNPNEVSSSEYRLEAGVGAGPRACPNGTGQPWQERGRPRGAAPTAPQTSCGVNTDEPQREVPSCGKKPDEVTGEKSEATSQPG